jgi:hypothetical protein
VRGNGEKPLLHLWSERLNLTRRVLAITDLSEQRLVLAVKRFGRTKPERLESERDARQLSREEFRAQLSRLLSEQFPDETVESLTVSSDLEHTLSGNYVRGISRRGSKRVAFLAVADEECSATVDCSLTFALLWLTHARHLSGGGMIAGLRLILPKNTGATVAHRLGALDPRVAVELYEHEPLLNVLEKVDPRRA